MENNQPKKLITRILEFAGLFALAAFLMRLGVCYLLQIWPVLLITAIVIAATAIGFHVWKNGAKW
jgi:hypothetical protein